jgi:hypothetical protein
MCTSQGMGTKWHRANWRPLVTRRISFLIYGQRYSCRTKQEDAADACSSVQAFNSSTLDGPPGATPISGEAATPHKHLSLFEGGALTTAPGTDLWLVCDPRRRTVGCWNS